MTHVEYLDVEDVLGLVRALGVGPVRDVGLLDAACARPQSTAFGADASPTVDMKAAALLHSIVGNHALIDGNKRLGWLATTVFLDLSAHTTSMSDSDAFDLVLAITSGSIEVEETAWRLRSVG